MRRMNIPVLVLLCSLLGCVPTLTREQLSVADYGRLEDSYRTSIMRHMETKLYDAESARYLWDHEPVRGYAYVNGSVDPPQFGYLVEVQVNAKNRLGGYVGYQAMSFLVRDTSVWMLSGWTTRRTASQ